MAIKTSWGWLKGTLRVKTNTPPLPEDTVETHTLKIGLAASENAGSGTPTGVFKKLVHMLSECSYLLGEVGRMI